MTDVIETSLPDGMPVQVRSKPRLAAQKVEAIESFERFLRGEEMPRYPLSTYLEVSNACDLRCAMCGPFSALSNYRKASISKEKRGFMDPDRLGDALEGVLAHSLEVHCFGYGEPTLNPAFPEFLHLLHGYEVTTDFFTNGMHLTDENVRLIVDTRVAQITVSFSGATKADYENIYIGGVYEQVLDGLRRLRDYKREQNTPYPYVIINSLAYNHHVEKLESFMEVMGEAGVSSVVLGPVFESFAELSPHIAKYRHWVDGPLIQRARKIGELHGVLLLTGGFEANGASNEAEYESHVADKLRHFRSEHAGEEPIPVHSFKKFANSAKQFAPTLAGVDPKVFKDHHLRSGFLQQSDEELRKLYDFQPASTLDSDGIYCFEPFKTFYVTKNWNVKPCCNAVSVPPSGPLGSLSTDDGLQVWEGRPFDMLRQGVVDGAYPNYCHGCLRNKTAYLSHFLDDMVGRYRGWFEHQYHIPFARHLMTGQEERLVGPKLWNQIGKLRK